MMKKLPLILTGLACFILFAIVLMPASVAYQLTQDNFKNIQLTGLSGTLWNGHASSIQAADQAFDNVHWSLSAWPLLLGQARVDLDIRDSDYPLSGQLKLASQHITAHQLKGQLPAALISQMPNAGFVRLSGQLFIDIKELVIEAQQLNSAQGKITLNNGAIQQPIRGQLGTIQLALSNEAKGVLVTIQDQQAPIGINGKLRIKPKKQFSFNALFMPTAKAEPFLVTMLKNVAREQADGSLRIQTEGSY